MENTVKKIMIVEDEAIACLYLQNILQKNNYSVAALTSNGKDAVRKALEIKPDLILMDVLLKGDVDGIDAANIIHESLEVPVVYITASTDPRTRERAEKSNMAGYLNKPYQEEKLLEILSDILKPL